MKVAIVGRASTKYFAPWHDDETEIWSLADQTEWDMPRWTRYFELHDRAVCNDRWSPAYKSFLATDHGKPLYTRQTESDWPSSQAYPWETILAKYGRYFTSSFPLMVALALELGCKELSIFGVDMWDESEYATQRPCAEYLLGIARGRGCTVAIPEQSALLKQGAIYALDYTPDVCQPSLTEAVEL